MNEEVNTAQVLQIIGAQTVEIAVKNATIAQQAAKIAELQAKLNADKLPSDGTGSESL